MFLEKEELKSVAYAYQVDQITEGDDDIVFMAINAGVDEVKSYLKPNSRRDWIDGRPRYDVEAIFSATATNRNAFILELCKNVALWHLVLLCNVDILYDKVKDRYDRAISSLKDIQSGKMTMDLPLLSNDDAETDPEALPFRFGSRTKFNHE